MGVVLGDDQRSIGPRKNRRFQNSGSFQNSVTRIHFDPYTGGLVACQCPCYRLSEIDGGVKSKVLQKGWTLKDEFGHLLLDHLTDQEKICVSRRLAHS